MDINRRRNTGRIVALLLTMPLVVFVALLTLLYLPPVQRWAVEKATRIASDAAGLDIRVGSLRLAFPLDLALTDVVVCDTLSADTLASMDELRTGVAVWPLLRGQVQVERIELRDVQAHTGPLIPSVGIDGRIGRLRLKGGDVDLAGETVQLESLLLHEADVSITLLPDTAPKDTASSPVGWKFFLDKAEISHVDFQLMMPADTMSLSVGWTQTEVEKLAVNLEESAYGALGLTMADGHFRFNSPHVDVKNADVRLDSLYYKGIEARAVIRQIALLEQSGFHLTNTAGNFRMDSSGISLPQLRVETTSSAIQASGTLPWSALKKNGKEKLALSLHGHVSEADIVALLSQTQPEGIGHTWPATRLTLLAEARGNMNRLQLDTLLVQMDSVATLSANGDIHHLMEDDKRTGTAHLRMKGHNLDLLAQSIDTVQDGTFAIPQDIHLDASLSINRTHYGAALVLHEGEGSLAAKGFYDTHTEEYALNARADSLALHHFLPKDSLSHLTARVHLAGRGTDPYASTTRLSANASVAQGKYGEWDFADTRLKASLAEHQADVTLDGPRALMDTVANLHALVRKDTLFAQVTTGDFDFSINGADGLESLISQADNLVKEVQRQVERRSVRMEELKLLLPALSLTLDAGADNPISDYLQKENGIGTEQINVKLDISSLSGINGRASVRGFHTDSLELDTVLLDIRQDKAALHYRTLVSNAPGRQKPAFTIRIGGEVCDTTGSVRLNFLNGKGETGLDLGMTAAPTAKDLRLTLFPEHPTIGFRPFTLNPDNHICLSDSGRVTADVALLDHEGMGLRIFSTPNDEALQDLTAHVKQLNLKEILKLFPYAPEMGGMLDAELHYIGRKEANTFSGTLQVDNMTYGEYPLGTLGAEAVYLPTRENEHIVSLQLMRDGEVIGTADGKYHLTDKAQVDKLTRDSTEWASPTNHPVNPSTDGISLDINLERFPMEMANAFVPRDLITLSGWLNGGLSVRGEASSPRIEGSLNLDSMTVHSPLYAMNFRFDKTPVHITRNLLEFKDFNIYSKGKNPLTLTGHIDLNDFSHIRTDLQMRAMEYELLNAKKNRNSVLHGKVFVNLYSTTIKGELSDLSVRGTMNVLGNTDVTYILKESPLTVEDRLGSMVTFTNFSDTTATAEVKKNVSLGGIDMLLNVQIDQGAEIQVDMGSDNYVEVRGGGNLSLKYTPQGDLLLTGRYTLDGGEMKYSLPVIPLKTFNISRGSYAEFTGNPGNPTLNLTATERMRTSVTEENNSRYVNFDVGVTITGTLEQMGVKFTLNAPEDVTLQNQLAAMSEEERGKLAVTMLVTGMYVGGQGGTSGGFSTNNALNSFLQSEISNIAGSALKTVDVSIGVEDNYAADGTSQGGTDYSFRFAKRFWNNRLSVIIGGRISTGNEAVAEEKGNSFIDDISLEYRLDDSGTRYVKLFHTKNYKSILEGEIIETGVGLVLRRKVNKLGELFIFRRKEAAANSPKKDKNPQEDNDN